MVRIENKSNNNGAITDLRCWNDTATQHSSGKQAVLGSIPEEIVRIEYKSNNNRVIKSGAGMTQHPPGKQATRARFPTEGDPRGPQL